MLELLLSGLSLPGKLLLRRTLVRLISCQQSLRCNKEIPVSCFFAFRFIKKLLSRLVAKFSIFVYKFSTNGIISYIR